MADPSDSYFHHSCEETWPGLFDLFPEVALEVPPGTDTFCGQNVLITGAGGSIGRVLSRQVAAAQPSRLTLVDTDEHALSRLQSGDISPAGGAPSQTVSVDVVLGDMRVKRDRLRALSMGEPDVVFHTAAYKQVPFLEKQPIGAVENNLLATVYWARECRANGVEQFVFLSSDKAVDPKSVMGATKQLSERALRSDGSTEARQSPDSPSSGPSSPMKVRILRLCNVWGSQGSVVPIFWNRLQTDRRLPVTDPEMERHFISPETAGRLAVAVTHLGREADTLSCAPAVNRRLRLEDLATRLCEAAERGPIREWIERVGPRPGEKQVESIVASDEMLGDFINQPELGAVLRQIFPAKEATGRGSAVPLRELEERCASHSQEAVLEVLRAEADANLGHSADADVQLGTSGTHIASLEAE